MQRELTGKAGVERFLEVEHGAMGPHGEAREHARRHGAVEVGRNARQIPVAFEVFGEAQDAALRIPCRRRSDGEAAAMKIEAIGEAV